MIAGGKIDFGNSCLPLDFYMWFTYKGGSLPQFEFLNSRNFQINKLEEAHPFPGTDLDYVVFRVNGVFDQKIDFRNYPFDRFTLQVFFEDTEIEADQRIFVSDLENSGIDPLFSIVGWRVDRFDIVSNIHHYGTTFGEPNKSRTESYSQIRMDFHISRNHVIIFIKMVIPAILFLCIAVLSVLLPIEQISQKVSLCVASLFSSVAYHLSLSQGLPPISYLTFVDKMMLGNYLAIFIILIFTILIFLAKNADRPALQAILSKTSRIVVGVFFSLIIAWLVATAFLS